MPVTHLIEMWTALQPFVASSSGLLGLVVILWWTKKDSRSKEDLEEDQWEHKKAAALRRENDELRDKLRVLEADRDRGWGLARWWCMKAHDLRHDFLGALTLIPSALLERAPADKQPKPPELLPPIAEPPGVDAYSIPVRLIGPLTEEPEH